MTEFIGADRAVTPAVTRWVATLQEFGAAPAVRALGQRAANGATPRPGVLGGTASQR
ncbi:hypothetical protein [Streptomyces sp. NPDC005012]|uniref:hypothetical protein n=1 Tax=unclassified Streptomyces TaxID=2593676 RepID=UPI0033B4B308